MNLADYTQVSNFAVTSGMIVVALAFLAYVAEWGFARQVVKEEQPVAVAAGGVPVEPVEQETASRSDVLRSVAYSLTVLGTVVLGLAMVTRGLASQRVPWGNMYEFGVGGAFIALLVYVVVARVSPIEWVGGIVTGFALAVLGLAVST